MKINGGVEVGQEGVYGKGPRRRVRLLEDALHNS